MIRLSRCRDWRLNLWMLAAAWKEAAYRGAGYPPSLEEKFANWLCDKMYRMGWCE